MQNTHPIFIYAFPGMGKTTLCKQYGYIDYDCHEPSFPQPITHSIILTNDPTIESIAYILPQSFQDAVRKLPDYKQRYFSEINPSFLKNEYDLVAQKQPIFTEHITNDMIKTILRQKGLDK